MRRWVKRNTVVQAVCGLMYFYHIPPSEVFKLTPFQVQVLLEWMSQFMEKLSKRRRI
ncbi:MAG: hypothetical protein QXG12_06300 [Thermoproteota archaeon]